VRFFAPRGLSLREAVAFEHGAGFPGDRFEEIRTPLDPTTPLRRAAFGHSWFERNLARDVDAFVTDYHPVPDAVPTLVTVHDLRYFAAREFTSARRATAFRAVFPRLARRAQWLIVPSAAVGAECSKYLATPPARVRIVSNGLMRAWRDAAPRSAAAGPLLMAGFVEPRKNLATVLEALARTPSAPRLDVVGRGPPPAAAGGLVAAGRVRFLGPVDDARLVDLCRGAAALVHPSRYEGFGMSVIEAMSVGVPVLAARCAAVEEVAGGLATLLPPGDVDAWAAAMASPPASRSGARDHAHSFTWDAAAKALLKVAGCAPPGP